jgi:dTDP-3-amino-2,3,6-trideoxy-4-keto-D-glucose/dTDP-3-amino-3,4,6-trideoxy-alpha-D-glucose/dTDP-2,6-dideoxy-D-kanosamine transaminase
MQSGDKIPFNDLSRMSKETKAQVEAAISRVLASGWFILGAEHDSLETELSQYLGVKHTVLVGNGTDALELALAAVGVGNGDRVLTVANAGAYATIASRILGAVPIYCDISPDTLLATPQTVRDALAASDVKPKAIVVTHLFGAMAPVEEIVEIAREHGIAVVEDCAQSIGARFGGKQSGTFGDVATTSFYPTKNLAALGDGGAVYTNDEKIASSVRTMRQYGWDSKYHIAHDHGRNSRMDEMQAAIVRIKLPLLDAWNQRRRDIHSRYEAASSSAARVVNRSSDSFTAHLAVLATPDRDAARASLREAGIGTDIHYPVPDHKQDFPTRKPAPVSLPATEESARTVLSIPMFPELTDPEIDRICEAISDLGTQ